MYQPDAKPTVPARAGEQPGHNNEEFYVALRYASALAIGYAWTAHTIYWDFEKSEYVVSDKLKRGKRFGKVCTITPHAKQR